MVGSEQEGPVLCLGSGWRAPPLFCPSTTRGKNTCHLFLTLILLVSTLSHGQPLFYLCSPVFYLCSTHVLPVFSCVFPVFYLFSPVLYLCSPCVAILCSTCVLRWSCLTCLPVVMLCGVWTLMAESAFELCLHLVPLDCTGPPWTSASSVRIRVRCVCTSVVVQM